MLIQNAIKENKSVLGLHFAGNHGYVDIIGFIQIPEDFKQFSVATLKPPHRIKGSKPLKSSNKEFNYCSNSKYRDHCWICDGWQEQLFIWPTEFGSQSDQIFIHLSFDNFKAFPMELNKEKSYYQALRMCPRERIYFFFTVNKEQVISNVYNVDVCPKGTIQNIQFGNRVVTNKYDIKFNTILCSLSLHQINYIDILTMKEVVDDYFDSLIDMEPRIPDQDYVFETSSESEEQQQEVANTRKKWHIGNSIFKDYNRDTASLLQTQYAFEFDWKFSKFQNFKCEIKPIAKIYYCLFKDIFRYLSAFSVSQNVFVVSQLCLQDFINMVDLCHENVKLDIKFIESSKNEQVIFQIFSIKRSIPSFNKQIQQSISKYCSPKYQILQQNSLLKGLNRRQFIECLFRILIERQNKPLEEIADSIVQDIKTNIQGAFKGYDTDTWRSRRYWNQYCEIILKRNWIYLQQIYMKYSSSKIKSFNPQKGMYLEEFKQIWTDAGYQGQITDRELALAFSLSKITHCDEINTDQFIFISFMEFLEALSRVADRLNLPPTQQIENTILKNVFELNFLNYQIDLEYLPLCFKLESVIFGLRKSILLHMINLQDEIVQQYFQEFLKQIHKELFQILRFIMKKQKNRQDGIEESIYQNYWIRSIPNKGRVFSSINQRNLLIQV